MPPAVPGAAELLQLLERFTALTATAIQSVDSGDEAALLAALDARELLAPRTTQLATSLGDTRRNATSRSTRDALDAALRPIRAAAAQAERVNGELARKAHAARLVIGEQLDRLRHDSAARHAYASVAGRGNGAGRSHLDRTR
ncbi:MAG: hypothetical protein IT359_07860 [Gemmatimonadaceae bacterium]|nr:hypothetical protein [Gemmatimonadaceae bacterium]